jgi:hypothetical protein
MYGLCLLSCPNLKFDCETKILDISDGLRTGLSGFDSLYGEETFLFSTASRLVLGSITPPVQWVSRALSMGGKVERA